MAVVSLRLTGRHKYSIRTRLLSGSSNSLHDVKELMLTNDPNFNFIMTTVVGEWALRELPERINPADTTDPETLRVAFKRVMHCGDAKKAKNIVFVWAVDNPYVHESGNRLTSTIGYIEMTTTSLSRRWTDSFFYKLTKDHKHRGDVSPSAGLEELAMQDKNFSFYSQLIHNHGPLRIWYATLDELNAAALRQGKKPKETVRAWEKALIQAYRKVHGKRRRPLKNRRD